MVKLQRSGSSLTEAMSSGFACGETAIGIAHSDYANELIVNEPGLVDFVEIPYEQLVRVPRAIDIKEHVPVILHCASLSLAGNVAPDQTTANQLAHWVDVSETPWLGEHLAYVRADGVFRDIAGHEAFCDPLGRNGANGSPSTPSAPDRNGAPFNVGYTVNPQFSEPILNRVIANTVYWEQRLGVPVLLENGPMYFSMPGSTMSQSEFICALCMRQQALSLLLDLSHFAITCSNLELDPLEALDALPLERVVEVHLSGAREQEGLVWDDHSLPAPAIVFELLAHLLRRIKPRAVTFEYNWDASFPRDILRRDIERTRILVESMDGTAASA